MIQNFIKIIATCLINQMHIFLEANSSRDNTQVQQEKRELNFVLVFTLLVCQCLPIHYEFKHKMITHDLNNEPG